MANWNEINNSFSGRLNTNWTATDIAWDNVPYSPVEGQEWVRATLIPTLSENAALGLAKRNNGIFVIQIFTPLNEGSGRGYELAEMLDAIFGNTEFDEVVCYASDVVRIGDDDNGWYQTNLKVNFWSHERN
jgi:hypothetical protein